MNKDLKIVGLTSHYTGNHDNSAALIFNGEVLFAESEERISRIKHDRHFPVKSIEDALKFTKFKLSEIDYYASGSPPTSLHQLILSYAKGFKFTGVEDLLRWVYSRILFTLRSDTATDLGNRFLDYSKMGLPREKLIFVSHHTAHAEAAYHFSGMNKCLVVVLDGYGVSDKGNPLCGSIFLGFNGQLEHLEDIPVYSSIGLYYGAVTVALGFKLNDGEGKTMGLASYGKDSDAVGKIRELFPYFNGKEWIPKKNWLEVVGVSRPDYFQKTRTYRYLRSLIDEYGIEQVAFAVQHVFEEEIKKYFDYLMKKYQVRLRMESRDVAVAGGVFLNVKMNMRLLKDKIIDRIFIYPNPADGGVAVGAALSVYKKLGGNLKVNQLESVSLGCEFSKEEVIKSIKQFGNKIKVKDLGERVYKRAAKDISKGGVIGWFQGRGEWGPRALGHRSVLADPRHISTKERINSKLKERDWFMPFAPAILEELASDFLVHNYGTPFMTLTDDIKSSQVKVIPAAIHVDKTARSQIVKKKVNPRYWSVINEFYKITGVPVLLNTSFNRHGLPIVHTPKEAIEHLIWGCIDELIIETFLIEKNDSV